MRHALAVVAVLTMAVLGSTLPGGVSARSDAVPSASPAAIGTDPTRVLVAIPDPDVAADDPVLIDLASRLRLADPRATVITLRPGEGTQTVGPFGVSLDAARRVDVAAGRSFIVALPPSTGADGHVTVVEVLGDAEGVTAWRVGDLMPSLDELRLPAWRLPDPGVDAVALDGAWWSLVAGTPPPAATTSASALQAFRKRVERTPVSRLERLVDASVGDVTGDGVADLALSFRRPFRRTLLNASRPRRAWADTRGMSAHVGLFRPDDLSSIWVAGTLVRPVHRLAACTGALAVSYSTLRRSAVVAATAWAWQGFGFLPLPELPGAGRPTCIDIDRDGRPDAAIIERG